MVCPSRVRPSCDDIRPYVIVRCGRRVHINGRAGRKISWRGRVPAARNYSPARGDDDAYSRLPALQEYRHDPGIRARTSGDGAVLSVWLHRRPEHPPAQDRAWTRPYHREDALMPQIRAVYLSGGQNAIRDYVRAHPGCWTCDITSALGMSVKAGRLALATLDRQKVIRREQAEGDIESRWWSAFGADGSPGS